ncbi:AAA family ATPase [Salinibacterium sp. M195]|uniref:AAA family ATPase n=1 Tax=Salinibacterium sp. M195 TaxID=2583374 RepID=UPI001C62563E|nr:AAA family ATPase [Salinibacterium sp. M195]QYH35986.1 hypothetical protein FFT87_08495 [Salinibacterium sp. M195]
MSEGTMLTRIEKISGTGLLHHATGANLKLEPVSLIYAQNGRGKSTLSAVLRSVATGNSDEILCRKTIDGTNDQTARLQFQNGQRSIFANGMWDSTRPELLIFDTHFIESNVYSGVSVTTEHRRNLLDFAIGNRAVDARQTEEAAASTLQESKDALQSVRGKIEALAQGLSAEQFEVLPQVADIEVKLEALKTLRADAERSEIILEQALPSRLSKVKLDVDQIFEILNTQLEGIETNAEAVVLEHLRSLRGESSLEEWVSEGLSHQVGDSCPFCAQSTSGVELVEMYRDYFNQEFLNFKKEISVGRAAVELATDDGAAANFRSEQTALGNQIRMWNVLVGQSSLTSLDDSEFETLLAAVNRKLLGLFDVKIQNPASQPGSEGAKAEVAMQLDMCNSIIESQNAVLETNEIAINAYRAALAGASVEMIDGQIASLEQTIVRFDSATAGFFLEFEALKSKVAAAERAKLEARSALTTIMSATLDAYSTSINGILSKLGAAFSIQSLSNNFRGGTARSNYEISLRGRAVGLSGGEPAFDTALSEGDKRTLAFAFFVASALADPDLASKTLIIDDPVSSLDRHRRESTIALLSRLADASEQLIVLGHDAVFLRALRDSLNKSAERSIAELEIQHVGSAYSDFAAFDLDIECETPYYSDYRAVSDFVQGRSQDASAAAKGLRPLLEGHLHRRFPGLIPNGRMLGSSITEIAAATPPSPLALVAPWVPELRELNDFASGFHHSTEHARQLEPADDASVRSFGERVLNMIHGAPVPEF